MLQKIYKQTFLILLLLIVKSSFSQNYKEHKWIKAKPHATIPDSLKGEDAVMIQNNQFYYNDIIDVVNGKVNSKRTVMQRIKILTNKGLDEYSKVFINLYPDEKITVIDARAIKPNGKTVNFKTKDIKKLKFSSPYDKDTKYQQLRFAIPGAEVGDEIEIIYTTKSRQINTGDDIFLHTYLPCLRSSLTYSASKPFVHEIKMYNGMPKYVNHPSNANTVLTWSMQGLPAIESQHNAIYTREIPYIRFVVRKYQSQYNSIDITKNNWNEIHKMYSNNFEDNERLTANKKGYLKEFITSFKTKYPEKSNVEIFSLMHQFIYDNIEVKRLDEKDEKHALGYYLYNKYIDNHNLHLLYKELFNKLGIKFYICFGRRKYEGDIDRHFVAPHIIDHVYYSYYDGDILKFVYVSFPSRKFLLNEIPHYVQSTRAIMLSKKREKDTFCETKEITVPNNTSEVNYKLKKINLQIENLNDSVAQSNSTVDLSGVYSYFYRQSHLEDLSKEDYDFYNHLIAKEEIHNTKVELVDETNKYPFNYTIKATHEFPITFNQIDDNVYNLKLGQLLKISDLYATNDKRFLNYYAPYLYNDISFVTISFKNKINIENIDNFKDLSVKNDFGSVTVNVSQKDGNTLMLYVSYQINQLKLEPKEYYLLTDLNDALDILLNQNILLSTE